MKNIIIVGGGAGGLELAVGLAKKKQKETKVILIDKEKTHIWKPHLHEVASGALDSHNEQVDYLNLANKFGFNFVWGEMDSVNRDKKELYLKNKTNGGGEVILPERIIPYDTLVIGVGSTSNSFGTVGVKEYAYSLDDLDSANLFHQNMLEKILQKEYCEKEGNVFSVTIVGGGATGVELAAELTETTKKLSQFGLNRLQAKPIQITVVNAAEQLLPGMAPKISLGAKEILEERHVIVLNSTKVVGLEKNITKVESNGVVSDLHSDLIVWAAGVKSQDFLTRLDGLEVNRMNQLVVNQQLQTSDENIFAIGDCACVKWINAPKEGMNVPPRAQSAHQMSDYLINNLHKINRKEKVKGFIYKDFGSLISLGSHDTVGTLMGFLQGKNLFIEGKVAKFMYMNLYHHHQIKINGFIPAMFMLLGKLIQSKFKPKVKLH
jgi:NADH:ubiquinone reductase (H+-translocating)